MKLCLGFFQAELAIFALFKTTIFEPLKCLLELSFWSVLIFVIYRVIH